MLRKITANNRLLLTGMILQQQEAEKPKMTNEKSFWERMKESTNILGINVLCFGTSVEEEISSKHKYTKRELDAGISGWDRVKMAFLSGKNGEGPELSFAKQITVCGAITGFLYGGMRDYIKEVNLFVYTNDTSKFLNVKEARLALVKVSMKGFFRGALLTAPKTGALCGIFGASNTALALYDGKNGILEFSLAGAVTTGMMKWNLGIRGMISGCVTGGLAGLLLGSMISIILLPTGYSFSDVQYFMYKLKNARENLILENEKSNTRSDIEKYYYEKTEGLPVAFSEN